MSSTNVQISLHIWAVWSAPLMIWGARVEKRKNREKGEGEGRQEEREKGGGGEESEGRTRPPVAPASPPPLMFSA